MVGARPRALVTDAEERSALAGCRGLAAAGYEVSAVAHGRFAVGHWSRHSKRRISLPDPRLDGLDYVERLAEVLTEEPHDVLLPGSEASMLSISAHRELIDPLVATGLPEHDVVLRAVDKLLLPHEATLAGLAPPESTVGDTAEAAIGAAQRVGFPVVIKPWRSFTELEGSLRQGRARLCAEEDEVVAAVAELGAPVAVQEFVVQARIVSCAGVRLGNDLVGMTFARYSRTWPPQVGSASMARTIEPPDGLAHAVEDLLRRVGWNGIFELELLDLGRRFAAIDLNPRLFGWLVLAIRAGANLPALWCDHVLRRSSVRTGPAEPGVVYRWEDGELRSLLGAVHRLDLRTTAAIARPRLHVAHGYFHHSDPGPLVARALAFARRPRGVEQPTTPPKVDALANPAQPPP